MSAPSITPSRSGSTGRVVQAGVDARHVGRREAQLDVAAHHLQTLARPDVLFRIEIGHLAAEGRRQGSGSSNTGSRRMPLRPSHRAAPERLLADADRADHPHAGNNNFMLRGHTIDEFANGGSGNTLSYRGSGRSQRAPAKCSLPGMQREHFFWWGALFLCVRGRTFSPSSFAAPPEVCPHSLDNRLAHGKLPDSCNRRVAPPARLIPKARWQPRQTQTNRIPALVPVSGSTPFSAPRASPWSA